MREPPPREAGGGGVAIHNRECQRLLPVL